MSGWVRPFTRTVGRPYRPTLILTHRMKHGRSGVPPLQAVDRRRREARLLDDDRSGSHAGSRGGFARRLGAAARDRRHVWRSADLRLGHVHHVFTRVVLLLRPPEEELPRSLPVPRPRAEGAAGAPSRSQVEEQGRKYPEDQPPRRSGTPHHRLASGSVRTVRCAGRKGRDEAREVEADTGTEEEKCPAAVGSIVEGLREKRIGSGSSKLQGFVRTAGGFGGRIS